MRQHCILSQPNLAIFQRSGTEGPRHDPYGWEEFEVHRNGNEVMYRAGGLGYVRLYLNGLCAFELYDRDGPVSSTVDKFFELHTGHSRREWEEATERLMAHRMSKCSECGSKHFKAERGYPGETFTVCADCGHVVASDMNYSAIE